MVNTKINYFLIITFIFFSFNKGQKMTETGIATLGGGCFWCVEAVYQRIDGVISVIPGYAGGKSKTTTYKEICTGKTCHAEVAKIEFDKKIICIFLVILIPLLILLLLLVFIALT